MEQSMRRAKQQLTDEQACDLLARADITHGVLAVNGDDGYPYGLPISFVWMDGKVWFHHARAGKCHDCLQTDARVCFTAVGADDIDQEHYTSNFLSVVVYGTARLVETDEERYIGLKAIMDKYAPDMTEAFREQHARDCTRAHVWVIEPASITGKRGSRVQVG